MTHELQHALDDLEIERIRMGDPVAMAEAIDRIQQSVNGIAGRLSQLVRQSATTPIFCRLYRSLTTQTIATGTDTFAEWETPAADGDIQLGINVGGLFNPDAGSSGGASAAAYMRLFEPGLYLIEANILWDTNTTGDRRADIVLLGSLDSIDRVRTLASTSSATGVRQRLQSLVPWKGLTDANWNGRIAVQVFQNSGGDRTIGAAGNFYDHWFAVTRVGYMR